MLSHSILLVLRMVLNAFLENRGQEISVLDRPLLVLLQLVHIRTILSLLLLEIQQVHLVFKSLRQIPFDFGPENSEIDGPDLLIKSSSGLEVE